MNYRGIKYSSQFMTLPSKRKYPGYYQFVQHPICFTDIRVFFFFFLPVFRSK